MVSTINTVMFRARVRGLVAADDWKGLRSALEPWHTNVSMFNDSVLLSQVLMSWARTCTFNPDWLSLHDLLFPTMDVLAARVDAYAQHCSAMELEQLLINMQDTAQRVHRAPDAMNLLTNTLADKKFPVWYSFQHLLQALSRDTVNRLTARSVRLFVEYSDTALCSLLLVRHDLDPNVLCEDGAPGWYAPRTIADLLDTVASGAAASSRQPWSRIDFDTRFAMGGFTATLLQHMLADVPKIPERLFMIHWLLRCGARPLDTMASCSPPFADVVIRYIRWCKHAYVWGTHVLAVGSAAALVSGCATLADAGLLVRLKDADELHQLFDLQPAVVSGVMGEFQRAVWQRRCHVLGLLFAATTTTQCELGAQVQPGGEWLRVLLRAWELRRVPLISDSVPLRLPSELAGLVVLFL